MKIPVSAPDSNYRRIDQVAVPFVYAEESVSSQIKVARRYQRNNPRNPWVNKLRIRTKFKKRGSATFFLVNLDGLDNPLPIGFAPHAIEDVLEKNPQGIVHY